MRRFITRHSQIPDGSSYDGGHLFPVGETLISELGREQARLLGVRLKEANFSGVILSSPFVRTMLTAEIIAEETGAEIIPFAPIHEIFRRDSQLKTYRGMTSDELKSTFSHVRDDFELQYPWWPTELEGQAEVQSRVDAGVRLAEELYGDGDILYVAHGASCDALVKSHKIIKKRYPLMFNCSLSYVDPDAKRSKRVYCDTTHLPYSKTTSNYKYKADFDTEQMTKAYTEEINLPEWLSRVEGKRVLHIGDTESQSYPFFRALIAKARPNIIIHTGDMADEVKVGRIPGTRDEYLHKLAVISEILNASGAEEIIIVPGNNDLPGEIARHIPTAKIVSPGSTVTVDGMEVRLSHSAKGFASGTKWGFYGHGFTDDRWKREDNREGGECRFNACYGATVCCPSKERFSLIKVPEIDLSIL